jgi:hypothetical protein
MAISLVPNHWERELAQRSSDGIEVVLLWHTLTDELTICVSDERTDTYFELAAEPEQALDVFEHPYAYAARAATRNHGLRRGWRSKHDNSGRLQERAA